MDNDTKALFEAYKSLKEDTFSFRGGDNFNFDGNNSHRNNSNKEFNRAKDIKIEFKPTLKKVDNRITQKNFDEIKDKTDKEGTYKVYNDKLLPLDWYLGHIELTSGKDIFFLIKIIDNLQDDPLYKIKYHFEDENETIDFIEKNILK